jgi:hypothetical protein
MGEGLRNRKWESPDVEKSTVRKGNSLADTFRELRIIEARSDEYLWNERKSFRTFSN